MMRLAKYRAAERPLLNPGKGWVLYGSAPEHAAGPLALGALGYQRFSWVQLEPDEGQFDWQPVDRFVAGWARAGKQSAFGVMCANSHSADPYTTPKWLFDAGAGFREISLGADLHATPGGKIVPDFNDPVFLGKLAAFLRVLAQRYDGDPRLAFIDIRSYGNWGEGHLWPFGGEELTADQYRQHLALHLAVFTKTRLALSCESAGHAALYDWAMTQGIAARRDGICGNSNGSETRRAHGRTPAIFEFYGSYEFLKESGWWDGATKDGHGYRLVDCVETGRPSYIGMSQWGRQAETFLQAERPLIETLANRMGYHFVLRQAQWPATVEAGVPFTLALAGANAGVTYLYVPCQAAVALLDAAGIPVARTWAERIAPARWAPDAEWTVAQPLAWAFVAGGRYTLALGLFTDPADQHPGMRFGNAEVLASGWLPLGEINVR